MSEYATEGGFAAAGQRASLACQALGKVDTPPLFRTLDDLRRAQDAARDRLEALASRLEPLLSAAVPEKCDGGARPSASQFDEQLMGRVYSAEAMTSRIEELLRRLSI